MNKIIKTLFIIVTCLFISFGTSCTMDSTEESQEQLELREELATAMIEVEKCQNLTYVNNTQLIITSSDYIEDSVVEVTVHRDGNKMHRKEIDLNTQEVFEIFMEKIDNKLLAYSRNNTMKEDEFNKSVEEINENNDLKNNIFGSNMEISADDFRYSKYQNMYVAKKNSIEERLNELCEKVLSPGTDEDPNTYNFECHKYDIKVEDGKITYVSFDLEIMAQNSYSQVSIRVIYDMVLSDYGTTAVTMPTVEETE